MVLASVFAAAGIAITFEAPAAPLSRLVPQLGKTIGTELSVDARLKNEVVLVRVKEVSREDLLRGIAETTGGEWTPNAKGLTLSMSASADAKQKRADAIAKGETIRAYYAKRAEEMKRHADANSVGGLADAIFARLPVETLGSLGIRQRTVYSTRPVGLQRLLSSDLLKGLDLTRVRPTTQRVENGELVHMGPLHTLVLILGRNVWGDGPSATLLAADASGSVLTTEPTSPFFEMELRTSKASVLRWPDASLDVPPNLRAFADRIAASFQNCAQNSSTSEWGTSPTDATYSQEELAAPAASLAATPILAPGRDEPLAAVLGEGLARLAAGEGKNLIALLPDEAFGPSAEVFSQPTIPARELERRLRSEGGMAFEAKEGWLFAKPRYPSVARTLRADRAPLARLIADVSKSHNLTLDQQATYAAAQPLVPTKASLEGTLLGLIDLDWGRRIAASSERGERELLRIVSGLGGTKGLRTPRSFGSLPPSVRSGLNDLFYRSESGPAIRRLERLPDGSTYETEDADHSLVFIRSIATDRTALFPNGIPSGAILSFSTEAKDVLVGWASNGLRPILSGEGTGIALSSGSGRPMRAATTAPRLASYVPAKLATFEIAISVPERWSFARSLFETRYDAKAAPIAFADLPANYREQIENAEKELAKSIERHQTMRERRNRQQP